MREPFDKLEWDYRWTTLAKFGPHTQFISIKSNVLCANPLANGLRRQYLLWPVPSLEGHLPRLPLSLLPFACSLKPLAQLKSLTFWNMLQSSSGGDQAYAYKNKKFQFKHYILFLFAFMRHPNFFVIGVIFLVHAMSCLYMVQPQFLHILETNWGESHYPRLQNFIFQHTTESQTRFRSWNLMSIHIILQWSTCTPILKQHNHSLMVNNFTPYWQYTFFFHTHSGRTGELMS